MKKQQKYFSLSRKQDPKVFSLMLHYSRLAHNGMGLTTSIKAFLLRQLPREIERLNKGEQK